MAKQEPGKLSYGSAGIGTSTHLGAELLAQMAGVKLLHVPYRGMGPALIDLTAGRVQLAFVGLAPIKASLRAARSRRSLWRSPRGSKQRPRSLGR